MTDISCVVSIHHRV